MKQIEKTTDLGQGFFWNQYNDGSATVRNCDVGIRVDLPPESVALLREIIKQENIKAAA